MEPDMWRAIADQTRGLGITYRPFLLGEPLMYADLPDVVAYVKRDKTAAVELHTNVSLLGPDMREALVSSGLDVMRLSIDGFSRRSVEGSRGFDRDDLYYRGAEWLELSRGRVRTEARMIVTAENKHECEDYRRHWEGLGAEVVFTSLYRYPWCGQTESASLPCRKIATEMFVLSDGRVTLCCWDADGSQIVGDLRQQTVHEAWMSAPMQHARSLLRAGRRCDLHVCSRCDAYAHEGSA